MDKKAKAEAKRMRRIQRKQGDANIADERLDQDDTTPDLEPQSSDDAN